MAADLGTVIDAVVTKLKTIASFENQGAAGVLDRVSATPCFGVAPDSNTPAEHNLTCDGLSRWHIRIRVWVSRAGDAQLQQRKLWGYMSTSGDDSVIACLHADPTLSGAVRGLIVGRAEENGVDIVGDSKYMACDWPVTVYA